MSSNTQGYGSVPSTEDRALIKNKLEKETKCHDVLFAILFVVHLVTLIVVWLTYDEPEPEPPVVDNSTSSSSWLEDRINGLTGYNETAAAEEEAAAAAAFHTAGVYKFAGIITLVALVMATLALGFMAAFAGLLVEIALVSSLCMTAGVAVYGFWVGKLYMGIAGVISLVAAMIFTACIWRHIPFAASNLRTALRAIRTNMGLVIMVYVLEVVAFAFALLWMEATGILMNTQGFFIIFLMFLSFAWTQQIINNFQHVMVASVLGTWWYNPRDANSCWDDGLNEALYEGLTYNFGSICFGSLLAGIFAALKYTHRMAKSQGTKCSCLTCCLDCILGCFQSMMESFNKWAFVFVGIHGYSYLRSGRQVMELFKARGWSSIISDSLADTMLWFMTVSIALLSGLVGWALVTYDNDIFEGIGIDKDKDDAAGFVMGALIGYLVGSIMMGVVSSAVNAVIVCFAESPAVFKQNYPTLCAEMLTAWKEAYPDECSDDFTSLDV